MDGNQSKVLEMRHHFPSSHNSPIPIECEQKLSSLGEGSLVTQLACLWTQVNALFIRYKKPSFCTFIIYLFINPSNLAINVKNLMTIHVFTRTLFPIVNVNISLEFEQ